MRIRSVVQRYGPDVAGGAESFCRSMSRRLTTRGHQVQVVTSTATDYLTWEPVDPAGISSEDGVEVVRLNPRCHRDPQRFAHLDQRVANLGRPLSPVAQQDWLLLEGPNLEGLAEALRQPTDVTAFYTYLYPTTATGVPLASPWSPTLVHPTAHSEPQLNLQIFDRLFHHTDMLAVSTPEEEALLATRTRGHLPIEVLGIGVDPIRPTSDRTNWPVAADAPYVVMAGRVDPAKGSMEAIGYFSEFKRRHPGPLQLVVVGRQSIEIPTHRDIVTTGFVDRAMLDSLVAGAMALLQPSYLESFSLVLAEAWTAGVPAIVQQRCPATAGQVDRSGGGLLYGDYAGFESSLELLVSSPAARHTLGEAGRRYVADNYDWDAVLDRYETILDSTTEIGRRRLSS